MGEVNHRYVDTNGIKMHVAEQGEGPLVVLCHGFPELWYSWRHQLPALAKAGYHAVAPDQRGYGQTDRPEAVEAYNILALTGDIVGLVAALGEERAIVIGHDWGSPVAWHCALLRPDIFHESSIPLFQQTAPDSFQCLQGRCHPAGFGISHEFKVMEYTEIWGAACRVLQDMVKKGWPILFCCQVK